MERAEYLAFEQTADEERESLAQKQAADTAHYRNLMCNALLALMQEIHNAKDPARHREFMRQHMH